jgi:hypothetical protein
MNLFKKIAEGFVWVGKEIGSTVSWLPKIVKISDEVKTDSETLLPELAQVVDDVAELAKAAIADSASDIASAENLVAAIAAAAGANSLNIAADERVVVAFVAFIKTVSTSSNYADVLRAVKALVVDYEKFGVSAKEALKELEVCAE